MADKQQLCALLPCYVCKKTMHGNVAVITLICGHVFHQVCVEKFQGKINQQNCPMQIYFGCEPHRMMQKIFLPVPETECLDREKKLEEKVCNANYIFIIDSRLIHLILG